jgi:CO/xanthine dehydrogenase Mo-binding subunit
VKRCQIGFSTKQINLTSFSYDNNPTGVGEIGLPTAAPALTSANLAATGVRIRQLQEHMSG